MMPRSNVKPGSATADSIAERRNMPAAVSVTSDSASWPMTSTLRVANRDRRRPVISPAWSFSSGTASVFACRHAGPRPKSSALTTLSPIVARRMRTSGAVSNMHRQRRPRPERRHQRSRGPPGHERGDDTAGHREHQAFRQQLTDDAEPAAADARDGWRIPSAAHCRARAACSPD